MHKTIDFPNLGIHLKNVGKTISVFHFDIAYYGVIIGLGILAGLLMAMHVAKKTGQNQEDYIDLAIYGVIFGIIGARVYYVVFSWDMYKNDLLSIFNIRQGGLAIYGGVIAAVITVFVFAKRRHLAAGYSWILLVMGWCSDRRSDAGVIFLTEKLLVNIRTVCLQ